MRNHILWLQKRKGPFNLKDPFLSEDIYMQMICERYFLSFALLHLSHKLQEEQPQEQVCLPCFFFLISLKATRPTINTIIANTIAVGKLNSIKISYFFV